MDPLTFFYHHLADQFLALGSDSETQTPLDEAAVKDMQANFSQDGPPFVPGKCNVLTTYIPVKHKPVVKFLSKTAQEIASLFPDNVPYYLVPPSDYHISLVMIQDIRPVGMNDKEMTASAFSRKEVRKMTRVFAGAMRKQKPEKYDLKLYGTFFAPKDGALLAGFEDECQTCRLRAEIEDPLQGFRRRQWLKFSKGMVHITLLRPLAQLPPDLLRALQGRQREIYRANAGLTLPVREIALGRETVWMHRKVKVLKRIKLR